MTEAEIIRDARIVFAAKLHARLKRSGRMIGVPCTRACPEAFTLPAETVLAVWDATPDLVGGSLATRLGDELRRLRLEARAHALKTAAVPARDRWLARVIAARRMPTRAEVAPPVIELPPDRRRCAGCGQPFDLVCDCED